MIDAENPAPDEAPEPVAEPVAEVAAESVSEVSEPVAEPEAPEPEALELGGEDAQAVEPEAAKTDIVVQQHGDVTYYRNDAYCEFPCEGGVKRCEAGDYVVSDAEGLLTIMPPEIFAERYPELQDAPAEGGE